jgi:hypothetical protein
MGYIAHHAIIVTGWQTEAVEAAHAKATELFAASENVTSIMWTVVNVYGTFVVTPDGSKEGWADSDAGDQARVAFLAWLDMAAADRDQYLDFAEIRYGGDDPDIAAVVFHNGGSR